MSDRSDPPSFRPAGNRPRPDGSGARPVAGRAVPDRAAPDRGTPERVTPPGSADGEDLAPRRAVVRKSVLGDDASPRSPRATARSAGAVASDQRAAQAEARHAADRVASAASAGESVAPARAGTVVARPGGGVRPLGSPRPPSYEPTTARRPQPAGARPAAPAGGGHGAPPTDPGTTRPTAPRPAGRTAARPARRGRGRRWPAVLVFLLVLALAWPVGLLFWANGRISHTDPLPAGADTPGTTYLLAGSDSRADGAVADNTPGERSDTIMLLHDPRSGPTALISLPRDTYVQIPGHGGNKLNAAYALGGPALLTETVEGLTGIGVDHYVEVGMGGVTSVVDAVGGVNLCLDYDVDDELSGLDWTAGCHDVDGATALEFARMRYSDPQGDIGRGERQRQVLGASTRAAASPATILNPIEQVQLLGAGTDALLTDPDTGIVDLGRMALSFRGATGPGGIVGAPPIASLDHHPGGIGATVLLDEDAAPEFFRKLAAGDLTEADLQG